MKEKKYLIKKNNLKGKLKEEVMSYSNFENTSPNLNNLNLKDLQNLQERIDDEIEILKGEESLKNHPGYTMDEINVFMNECLKK